jgi:serine protease Do/serine protease DegQ
MRAGVLLLVALTVAAGSRAALPGTLADGTPLPSLAPVMEQVTPAVVNIATYTTVEVRNPLFDDPFFRFFLDVPSQQRRFRRTRSAGSGVVVDAKRGHVITNDHVVAFADEIAVTLADGRTVAAELVGSDAQVDLAVLRLDPEALARSRELDASLAAVTFGDSAALRVGDFVVAVGNPFGIGQTVTSGIVSAIGRSGLGIEGYEDFIQTDASINPGNSGGALVDLAGRLVGINTAIFAPSGGNVGIGFAIPSNMVRAIVDELVAHGEVRRGHIGATVQGLNPELAQAFGIRRLEGVVVTEVEPESPADRAGLRVGDVITRVGERAVREANDYRARAAVVMVGDAFEVAYVRDGAPRSGRIEVGPEEFEKVPGDRLASGLSGARLQTLRKPEDGEATGGVVLLTVQQGSRPWQVGLRPGDVIVAANGQPVRNMTELARAVKRSRRRLVVRILRGGAYYDVRLAR